MGHYMHLWFKRTKSSEVAFGDADYHSERMDNLLNIHLIEICIPEFKGGKEWVTN